MASTALALTNSKPTNTLVELRTSSGGYRTICDYTRKVQADADHIHDVLCDYNAWAKWISPGSIMQGPPSGLLEVEGQQFTESFGLFFASQITWRVKSIIPNRTLSLITCANKGTFGWDEIEIEISMDANTRASHPECSLNFRYSWIVENPIISFIERNLVRQSMIDDNSKALDRLVQICEHHSSGKSPAKLDL